jgi:hypothetical protein
MTNLSVFQIRREFIKVSGKDSPKRKPLPEAVGEIPLALIADDQMKLIVQLKTKRE